MDTSRMTTSEKYCFYVITLCFLFFGYIVVMSYQTRFPLPTEASMILTAVIGIATATSGYIIGSNSQSKRKDDLIGKAMDTVPASVAINTTTLTLNWVGSYDTAPGNPAINDAYIDTKQKKNLYWDGTKWLVTTQNPA